jgi:dsDNA-specific endonuclease/ATPase MutS2
MDLNRIIRKVLEEQESRSTRYMFFSNLEQMKRQCEMLLEMDQEDIESILENGHDWAQDHISEAKNNMDQVFDFIMNESKKDGMELSMSIDDKDMVEEGRKKKKNVATNKDLWQQSLSWAKQRYEVCPSAYCNGAAVKRYNSKGGGWKKG